MYRLLLPNFGDYIPCLSQVVTELRNNMPCLTCVTEPLRFQEDERDVSRSIIVACPRIFCFAGHACAPERVFVATAIEEHRKQQPIWASGKSAVPSTVPPRALEKYTSEAAHPYVRLYGVVPADSCDVLVDANRLAE